MCGIVGLIGSPGSSPSPLKASQETFLGLTTLQHRGQDAAGILSYDEQGFHRVKNLGLVESVFTRENMSQLTGHLALGHARYATIGRGDLGDVQPFLISYPYGIGLVHNGNIVNVKSLAQELKVKYRRHLVTSSDSEVMLNLLAQGLSTAAPGDQLSFDSICTAVSGIYDRVEGSYSILSLIADHGLIAFRDPNGIRPLVWGSRPGTGGVEHAFASESVALSFMGYEPVRDLAPGEVVFIDMQGGVHTRVISGAVKNEPARHCMFEWVYFASPESVIDGVPVYGTRIQLGKKLAGLIQAQIDAGKIAPDLVVPVPETSRIAAIALSEEIKVPYREVLIKNRYIKRTFILDSQEKRQSAVNLKLSPVRSEIVGKNILLVDDSIVRGTTSKKIIELVRKAGAKKVYFVSTCPPIVNPCYYGIDFPDRSELIAAGKSPDHFNEEICRELGADAVIYLDVPGLAQSIRDAALDSRPDVKNASFKPCMACLDGNYPTRMASAASFADTRAADRTAGGGSAKIG